MFEDREQFSAQELVLLVLRQKCRHGRAFLPVGAAAVVGPFRDPHIVAPELTQLLLLNHQTVLQLLNQILGTANLLNQRLLGRFLGTLHPRKNTVLRRHGDEGGSAGQERGR